MAATAFWLTFSITRIQTFFQGKLVGKAATGFFVKRNGAWWLVTNWHVLSGRHPVTGQPLADSGATPDTCVYSVPTLDPTLSDINVKFPFRSHDLGDALLKSARWLQHRECRQAIDIGVIRADDLPTPPIRDLLDVDGHDDQMWIDLGGELFLPGYPLGISAGGALPIWKRASLASSTELGHERDTYVLVDTATREGMSGAPCLAISNREYFQRAVDSPKMTRIQKLMSWRLLGVYSGRINPSDNFEAQLGIVWRKERIIQVIDDGIPATVTIRG